MSDAIKKIGDYEVLSVLGSGGMGRVYKVRNSITDRIEAMKVLLPDLQGHEEVAARFLREIKVLAALNHPNIASLHTALTIDNQLVMIMEFVEGQSLSSRLDRGAIPVGDALNYLEQLLSALSYAHQHHVIHRDIKPANMMLTPQGTIKLMDFGIARTEDEPTKLTAPGSTLGSMSYMSPEQVKGESTDERSDIYSLGISFYEMVTGEKPFHGDSSFSIMAAHINQAPRPPIDVHPGLPANVNDIILTAIAKRPDQRFQTAEAFRYAVHRALQSVQEEKTFVQGSYDATASFIPPVVSTTAATASVVRHEATVRQQATIAQPGPTPPVATIPVAAAMAQGASSKNHRGLYMGLGALVLIAVIVAAGLYMPGHKQASAAPPAAITKPQPEAVVPTALPKAESVESAKPIESAPLVEKTKPTRPIAKRMLAQNMPAAAVPAENTQSTAAAANTAELDAVEHDIDQLTSRAAAIDSSLNSLQRQQEAAGYGLRGDIVSKQASMKVNLAKAQSAMEHNDAARAKKYSDMTATDVEALEKFLGR